MSWNPAIEPACPAAGGLDSIETLIIPRARDLGGFEVRRALPAPKRQMVGPFIFFDQIGPAEFVRESGIDVRPHPHIGLATVTYLLRGAFEHRDSTGAHQTITPGAVNWMVAGRGVTHSERTGADTRAKGHELFGIQTWVALPERHEEDAASFEHHDKAALPVLEGEGKTVRLILGDAWGEAAPARTFSRMFYADAVLEAGAAIPLPDDHEDRGVFVASGAVEVAGETFEAGRMMVFRPGDAITLKAGPQGARLLLLGGDTLEGPRHIWWNFVASSRERIEEAKADWRAGRFDMPVGDDAERIPLP